MRGWLVVKDIDGIEVFIDNFHIHMNKHTIKKAAFRRGVNIGDLTMQQKHNRYTRLYIPMLTVIGIILGVLLENLIFVILGLLLSILIYKEYMNKYRAFELKHCTPYSEYSAIDVDIDEQGIVITNYLDKSSPLATYNTEPNDKLLYVGYEIPWHSIEHIEKRSKEYLMKIVVHPDSIVAYKEYESGRVYYSDTTSVLLFNAFYVLSDADTTITTLNKILSQHNIAIKPWKA